MDQMKRFDIIDGALVQQMDENEMAEKFGVELFEINETLYERKIERCPGCDEWVEVDELRDNNNDPCECERCRDFPEVLKRRREAGKEDV